MLFLPLYLVHLPHPSQAPVPLVAARALSPLQCHPALRPSVQAVRAVLIQLLLHSWELEMPKQA